ncbi:MAG: PQQ-like beta-propeller repeat protein [Planctomycetes bacterium]|nr:PQQ-like beta-propeller repeat protein [Planctomycetota bacterium]
MLSHIAFTVLATLAQDPQPSWPCWRGSDGTNVSAERGWSSEGAPEPLWRAQVGRGHSTVVIEAGRLYTQGFDEANSIDRVACLDALTGAELWRHEYPAELDADSHGGGTHATPSVDEGSVYSFERQGVLRALAADTGQLLWRRDLRADHDAQPTDYGFSSSPLVAGELVIVNAAKVIAVERADGKTRWASADIGAYYSTPARWRLGQRELLASFTRPGLTVLDLADGKTRFHFPFKKGETSVSAATPVVVDDARLFISSGYGHGAALVDFRGPEPVAEWETKAMRTQLSGCVLVDSCFYGFDETMLKCLDLAGKERWRTRGLGMGALAAADGRLIVISGNGELVIAAAQPEKYEEFAKRRVLMGSSFWASPVLCGGLIYVKSGEGELACLDHRPRAETEK